MAGTLRVLPGIANGALRSPRLQLRLAGLSQLIAIRATTYGLALGAVRTAVVIATVSEILAADALHDAT